MPKFWHHYEEAFAAYLKARRIPHVCVDQARLCIPQTPADRSPKLPGEPTGIDNGNSLKYFDYVVYGAETNLLVEVKGRCVPGRAPGTVERAPGKLLTGPRLECWTTLDDLGSLQRWKALFGAGFDPIIVFVFWCESVPPTVLFQEIFEHERRWYALRSIRVEDYIGAMKVRSLKWRTVDMSPRDFERLSTTFSPPEPYRLPKGCSLSSQRVAHGKKEPPVLPDPKALIGRLTAAARGGSGDGVGDGNQSPQGPYDSR